MSCGACGRKYAGLAPAVIVPPEMMPQLVQGPQDKITQGHPQGYFVTTPRVSTPRPDGNGPGYPEEVLVKPENPNE